MVREWFCRGPCLSLISLSLPLFSSLNCRKRKLKCDAAKPACQQCCRAGSESECSYDNGKALSKTQILQQRIAQLEAKLSTLQGRGGSSSAASPASSPSSSLLSGGGANTDPTKTRNNSNSSNNKKDASSTDSATLDPFGSAGVIGIRTFTRSPSIGAFPSSLYGDSAFGALDYGNPTNTTTTIAPQLISSGTQPRMSPYLQSTVDLYDPNAPWPNSSSSSSGGPTLTGSGSSGGGLLGGDQSLLSHPSLNRNSSSLYSSPSASSFNLNESAADPLSLTLSSGGTALTKSSSVSSNLDFRGSLRSMSDPNCITATEQGRRYLYVVS